MNRRSVPGPSCAPAVGIPTDDCRRAGGDWRLAREHPVRPWRRLELMFRFLFRLIVLFVLLGVVGVFLLGWRPGFLSGPAVATAPSLDTAKAREVGAEIGAKAAEAATQAQAALNDGSVTAKIKAKMALDDTVD